MAVDANHIYWTGGGTGTVGEANLDGSSPTTLISGPSGPFAVAVGAG